MPFRAVVNVDRCRILGSQSLNNQVVNFFLRIASSDDLFQGHSPLLILLLRHLLAPSRTLRSTREPDRTRRRGRRDIFSFLPPLHLEPAEAGFLLGVNQVDCLHRQAREAVRATDRAAKSSRIADVHSLVAPSANVSR